MSASVFEAVSKLQATDVVDSFDCGQPALNLLLQRHGLTNQKANSAHTYVCRHASGSMAGFYSLAVGSVSPEDEAARQWYESWEFEPSQKDSFQLFLMVKDLKGMPGG